MAAAAAQAAAAAAGVLQPAGEGGAGGSEGSGQSGQSGSPWRRESPLGAAVAAAAAVHAAQEAALAAENMAAALPAVLAEPLPEDGIDPADFEAAASPAAVGALCCQRLLSAPPWRTCCDANLPSLRFWRVPYCAVHKSAVSQPPLSSTVHPAQQQGPACR